MLLALPATDVADDPFVCATTPPSPGLPIRAEMFVFEGELWVEVADEPAVCWLLADWPAPWTKGSSAAADPAATAGRRRHRDEREETSSHMGWFLRSMTVRCRAFRARRALVSERRS